MRSLRVRYLTGLLWHMGAFVIVNAFFCWTASCCAAILLRRWVNVERQYRPHDRPAAVGSTGGVKEVAMTTQVHPEHPREAGLPQHDPDAAHDEAAHLLANEAYPRLAPWGFTRQEAFEWSSVFLEREHGGDVHDLVTFISEHED